ncbi:peptidylprolyl isomerase [Lysinibacillus sp. 54212]|uniref:peptidylprolyl isomerase n=1 Tax=Lysinibacillus sp. 54212 TaxID=3119829 RepID=UPI002FCB9F37
MKKSFLALTIAASVGLAACSNPGEEVVVSSSVGDLTKEDVYNEMVDIAGIQLLEQIMAEKILSDKYSLKEEDIQAEYDNYVAQYGGEKQFEALLAQSNVTKEDFKTNLRFDLLKQKATEDIKVTDKEIQAYYDQAKYELNARHILVKDEKKAKELVKKLKDGADFAELAKEESSDGSAANGGDLGWFTVGQMVPEFNDAAYALELNKVSEPVKSDFGYHIIEVTDKREVEGYGTLEEKKQEIEDAIFATKSQWETVFADLVKEAKVEVKGDDFKGAFSSK